VGIERTGRMRDVAMPRAQEVDEGQARAALIVPDHVAVDAARAAVHEQDRP
jgi:hypothetical protein